MAKRGPGDSPVPPSKRPRNEPPQPPTGKIYIKDHKNCFLWATNRVDQEGRRDVVLAKVGGCDEAGKWLIKKLAGRKHAIVNAKYNQEYLYGVQGAGSDGKRNVYVWGGSWGTIVSDTQAQLFIEKDGDQWSIKYQVEPLCAGPDDYNTEKSIYFWAGQGKSVKPRWKFEDAE